MVGEVSKTAQDVGIVWACRVLFPSSLEPSLHVLVFGKKTFLCLYIYIYCTWALRMSLSG